MGRRFTLLRAVGVGLVLCWVGPAPAHSDPTASHEATERAAVDLARGRTLSNLAEEVAQRVGTVHPPKKAEPPGHEVPAEVLDAALFGDFVFQLSLNREVAGDPRELETAYTLPQALSMPVGDLQMNVAEDRVGRIRVRNLTDDDATVGVWYRDLDDGELDLSYANSRFIDTPVGFRGSRQSSKGRISLTSNRWLPLWFAYDVLSQHSIGGLGPRDFHRNAFRLGLGVDLLIAQIMIEIPFRKFTDYVDDLNTITSQGVRVTGRTQFMGSHLWGAWQFHEIKPSIIARTEQIQILDMGMTFRNVYGIRGLDSRTRSRIEFHTDQIALTSRTRAFLEGRSVLTLKRFRKLVLEMGGATRQVRRRRLTRRGITQILGARRDVLPDDLVIDTIEERPTMAESWGSASYRGIKHTHVNLRLDASTITNNPLTNVGGADSASLLPDATAGLTVDLAYNPHNPYWGASLQYKTQERAHGVRRLDQTWEHLTVAGRYTPWPWLDLSGELSVTAISANQDAVRVGLTDATSLYGQMVYEASDAVNAFFDQSLLASSGALAGKEFVTNFGIEARPAADADQSKPDSGTRYRLVFTRDRLLAPKPGLVPFTEHLVTLQRQQRF